jgi:hypothetical protein
MVVSSARRLLTTAALTGLSIGLAGCMGGTTYGTGTDPGTQTLQDLAGIAAIGAPRKAPIEYGPRAPLVPPPPGTPLPPPGSEQASVAANWPKDPDVEQKKFKAESLARAQPGNEQPFGANDPKFRLPAKAKSDAPDPRLIDPNRRGDADAHTTDNQAAAAKKLYADARGVPTDENGQPIRQYLTDPPTGYRAPDPDAPVEVEAKPAVKKKFKWPWQQ